MKAKINVNGLDVELDGSPEELVEALKELVHTKSEEAKYLSFNEKIEKLKDLVQTSPQPQYPGVHPKPRPIGPYYPDIYPGPVYKITC